MSVTVSVTLTDKEFKEAEKNAKEAGLTISQYVKRNAIGADEFSKRYEELIEKSKKQPAGTTFIVMELFGSDWELIDKGVRLSLGRTFFHLVKRGGVEGVIANGKNSSNIQLYLREDQGK